MWGLARGLWHLFHYQLSEIFYFSLCGYMKLSLDLTLRTLQAMQYPSDRQESQIIISDTTQMLHREAATKFIIISCITFKVLPGRQCRNQASDLPGNLQLLAKSPSLPWRLSILKRCSFHFIVRKVMHKPYPELDFTAGWHCLISCGASVRESEMFPGNAMSFSPVPFSHSLRYRPGRHWAGRETSF